MKTIATIQTFEQIKCLADPRRLAILRLLMAGPATLTQLGLEMRRSPAWIQHHVRALQTAGLVEMTEHRVSGRAAEKLYRACSDAMLLQEFVLPRTGTPLVIFAGSHDLALEGIAEQIGDHLAVLGMPVGSLDGLVNLRQGLCQFSGSHLLDVSGEYNTPFVRHLFPDRDMAIITLADRTQGLILAAGNPKGIREFTDIARPDIRFVNRNPGSGTRLWLDRELHRLNLQPSLISGYARSVRTHSEVAALIESGQADAALGLQAAAHQHGLDFLPLFEERYDLVLPRENEQSLLPLLDYLQTAPCRRALQKLPGYSLAHSGLQIPL